MCVVSLCRWSKLRARVRLLMCPELRDTIDFHVTQYRKAHSWISESWITINGRRVFDCGSRTYAREAAFELLSNQNSPMEEMPNLKEALKGREVHEPQQMGEALRAYLDLPIDEALKSDNPFIKAFAMIDRRVGKERLAKIIVGPEEHSLVRMFYELRRASLQI